jgi:hypothetical protein
MGLALFRPPLRRSQLCVVSAISAPLRWISPLSSLPLTPFPPIHCALFPATVLRKPFGINLFRTVSRATGGVQSRSSSSLYPRTSNSFLFTSFADPHPLTPMESHRYKNRGGGRDPSFQTSYLGPLTPLFVCPATSGAVHPQTHRVWASPATHLFPLRVLGVLCVKFPCLCLIPPAPPGCILQKRRIHA